MTTDPATQRMCDETGHSCQMCPSGVRNLAATAHNLANRLEAALDGSDNWGNVRAHLVDLRAALRDLEPTTEAHFKALQDWRRP